VFSGLYQSGLSQGAITSIVAAVEKVFPLLKSMIVQQASIAKAAFASTTNNNGQQNQGLNQQSQNPSNAINPSPTPLPESPSF